MHLSWEIQRRKNCSRAKSLVAAWAILVNEDITIYYLVRRHSHSNDSYPNKTKEGELSLFRQH